MASAAFLLPVLLASPGEEMKPIADAYRATADRIVASALAGNDAWSKLQELCDDIGHRLSGSPQLEQAVQWAAETMQVDGQEQVRIEPVMVPKWVRGEESLVMVEPRRAPIAMLGLGNSIGTGPEGITAEVEVVHDEEELEALGTGAAGKIVLFNNAMPDYDPRNGARYGTTVRFRSRGPAMVSELGGVACLVRSVTATSLRSPHTGGTNYTQRVPRIPAAAVSVEDAEMIARLRARGIPVSVHLQMDAEMHDDVPSGNVIGELRGSERPEEIVIISGHLDSWDVGQGAHDDGANCVVAMEALNVLRKLDLRPRRTIRVVLWTNEENGLRGARAYRAEHDADMPNHVAAIEADSGCFAPVGYSVDCADDAQRDRAAAQMQDILSMLESIGATRVTTGYSGADVTPMRNAGVVLMGHQVDGTRYFDFHHTHADTMDKVDPEDLSRNVATMATVAFVLADMPGRIGAE